ncbi:hypothetical protein AnigIFM60653_009904 [Aspergillus niger]|nr:hypothetical protein AnigIFM50267_006727 [Aspergillus niger]GLA08373.1 hypothetical protein AnigIFM60653_009904 [Aspergillus niger]GLA19283.1 hypothetical protein AnigIFM62618_006952 [Aspergillus niger]
MAITVHFKWLIQRPCPPNGYGRGANLSRTHIRVQKPPQGLLDQTDFAQDKDRTQPQNWSTGRKLLIVLILCYVTFVAAFASAAFSTTIQSLEHEFHIAAETGTLGVTLYMLGFASGPVLWSPAPEVYGRRWPIFTGHARRLRKQTGIWELHTCHEEQEPSLQELVARNLARPIRLLFTQPIVLLFTLYMSFVYGLMYALLGDFPIIFQTIHRMNMKNRGLAFIALMIREPLGGV